MVEQNISGVKLEKLRQKANKKTKFMRRMPIIVFIICWKGNRKMDKILKE